MQRPLPAAPHARRRIRWQQRPGAGRAASNRASTSNGGSGGDTSAPRGVRGREGRPGAVGASRRGRHGPWGWVPPGSCPGTAGEGEACRQQVRRRQGVQPGPGLQEAREGVRGPGAEPEGREPRVLWHRIKATGREEAGARHQSAGW